MPDLSYSDDALNVRNVFFGAKAIIYVEGDDDVLFWQEIFSKVTDEPFEIEPLGGAPALDTFIEKISSGQLRAIAARDSDFLPILSKCSADPRVVYTLGYSIENSLYTSTALTQLVRIWSKSPKINFDTCNAWLTNFASTVAPLVLLDAANAISGSGIPTIGDNCSRYMSSPNSTTLCTNKVGSAAAFIKQQLPQSSVKAANLQIESNSENILMHIRGHFLSSAIHQYVVKNAKALGKKASISAESLYAAAILQFAKSLDSEHPHRTHYLNSARLAWQSV